MKLWCSSRNCDNTATHTLGGYRDHWRPLCATCVAELPDPGDTVRKLDLCTRADFAKEAVRRIETSPVFTMPNLGPDAAGFHRGLQWAVNIIRAHFGSRDD